MKKNLYYRAVFQHQNTIKDNIIRLFMIFASPFCTIIEVFIRKNMGRRYFKLSTSVILIIFMSYYPLMMVLMEKFFLSTMPMYYEGDDSETLIAIVSYILFIILFGYFSYRRYKDIKHIQSEFDMNHFSLSNGEPLPFFANFKIKGKPASPRMIEVILEPLFVFIVGLVLFIAGQFFVGAILTNSAMLYSLRAHFSYQMGDNFIMDKIDEMICNEELSKAFIDDEPASRGFRYMGKKPKSKKMREKIYDDMTEDEDNISDAV